MAGRDGANTTARMPWHPAYTETGDFDILLCILLDRFAFKSYKPAMHQTNPVVELLECRRFLSADGGGYADPFVPGTDDPKEEAGENTETPLPVENGTGRVLVATQFIFKHLWETAYNCHSYALHGGQGDPTDPGNNGAPPNWDQDPADDIDEDDKVDPDDPVKPGDVVVYGDDTDGDDEVDEGESTHTGIVTEVDENGNITRVTSKWGEGKLWSHHPLDVPQEYGDITGVYRPGSGASTQPGDGGSTTQPDDGGSTTQPGDGGSATQPGNTDSATQPGEGSRTASPAGSNRFSSGGVSLASLFGDDDDD